MEKNNLKHLAIIMDGNARWAQANNLSKTEGYKKGAAVAKELVPQIMHLGVEYLTLYAFSSENWRRPEKEVSFLMSLLSYYVEYEIKTLQKHQIRLKVIGNLAKLNSSLANKVLKATELTKDFTGKTVCIALSYGGRAEIANACQKVLNSGIKEISEVNFSKFLYDPEMPDLDLMIRPGNVFRISNFLLWQAAYAELYFTDKFWPELTIDDIKNAIEDYSTRSRSFGGRDNG